MNRTDLPVGRASRAPFLSRPAVRATVFAFAVLLAAIGVQLAVPFISEWVPHWVVWLLVFMVIADIWRLKFIEARERLVSEKRDNDLGQWKNGRFE